MILQTDAPPEATPAPRASETRMFREAAEAPQAIARQLAANAPLLQGLAERLRRDPPRTVITLARGSSDNAATFARYLIETRLGVLTSSAAPSVSSVYDAKPDMQDVLCLAISQSGRSPDLLAGVQAAAQAGAYVVALVNADNSPLSAQAHMTVPLAAGPELSVAATKSFLASLSAVVQLVALWADDAELQQALATLPAQLQQAWEQDWSDAEARLAPARDLYVLGRGLGLAIAQEAALKFKETCALHAEAFSAAEVRHGPMALVGAGFPILAFAQDDETRPGVEEVAALCAAQGAQVMQAGGVASAGVRGLPVAAGHPILEPLAMAQSFYRMACGLAVARGLDPDAPPHLRKVTETT